MDPDPFSPLLLDISPLLLTATTVSVGWLVFILILLLLGSALISASEVAYFSLDPKDIEGLQQDDQPSSKRILKLKDSPRKLLATILISNNFINIAIVIISEIVIRHFLPQATFDSWADSLVHQFGFSMLPVGVVSRALSFGITVVAVTFLLVLFGEVAPKIYANINNVKHARFMSAPMGWLNKIFAPLSGLLLGLTGGIEERVYRRRLLSNTSADKKDIGKAIELAVTDDESQGEVDILKGIINFGDVETKQIMKSRVDMIALDFEQGYDDVIQVIKDSGFSRLPVYEENIDKIIGILYVKDLLGLTKEKDEFRWQDLIRDNVLHVPEAKKIDELLKEFQAKRTHMAIVVDEYGGCAGLVTLEDIMEEVVGEIRDEFDQEEIDYVQLDDHNYLFEGKTMLNDVIRVLDLDNDFFDDGRGSADSLAGLILEIENIIPRKGRVIEYKKLKMTCNDVSKRRIEKVKITI